MPMQVILKSEVHNLGLPGDVVTVADGYGRNYLIPQGFAIRATAGAMKEAEALTRARLAQEAKTVGDAEKQKEAIEAITLRIPARVDDGGNLYGSVAVGDVQKVLKERGFTVDKRRIELKGTIKKIGEYTVPVQVHPQVTATATLEVVDVEGKVGVVIPVEDGEISESDFVEAMTPEGVDVDNIEDAALAAAAALEAEEAGEDPEVAAALAADAVEKAQAETTDEAPEAAEEAPAEDADEAAADA